MGDTDTRYAILIECEQEALYQLLPHIIAERIS